MPPYYTMGYAYELIQFNWRKAQTALKRAKEIYIIGYSMPDEDMAFLSLVNSVKIKWLNKVTIDVWNTDPTVFIKAQKIFGSHRVKGHNSFASHFHFN